MSDEKIISYKGFDKDFKCRGHQYAVGETYTHNGNVAACESGFHACEYPLDVFSYYQPAGSQFAITEQSGVLHRNGDDSKVASSIIKVSAEIGLPGLIKAAIKYTTSRCKPVDPKSPAFNSGDCGAASNSGARGAASNSGDYGAASNSGYQGAASNSGARGAASNSGDCGAASNSGARGAASNSGYQGAASNSGARGAASNSGYQGAASNSGDCGAASNSGARGAASNSGYQGAASNSGYQGAASNSGARGAASNSGYQGAASNSGDCGAASNSGYQGAAMSVGYDGRVKGIDGSALFLVERDEDGKILNVWAGIAGQNDVLADTWYVLKNGQPIEWQEVEE